LPRFPYPPSISYGQCSEYEAGFDHTLEITVEKVGIRKTTTLGTELIAQVRLERALWPNELYISSILQDLLIFLKLQIVLLLHVREAPLLGDNNLLTPRELVSCPTERLHDDRSVLIFASDGQNNLANVHTSDRAVGFAPSATHASLQPISTRATQHLVDPQDVERMDTDTKMERVLSACLGDILVSADARCFEGFAGKLLVLVGHEMAAEREFVDGSALPS